MQWESRAQISLVDEHEYFILGLVSHATSLDDFFQSESVVVGRYVHTT